MSYLGLYVKKSAPSIKTNDLKHALSQIPGYTTVMNENNNHRLFSAQKFDNVVRTIVHIAHHYNL